ncbi:multidrug resistance protein 1 [Exidia glandulosa HHB12029]|uniref:Multidrug resistance protein 1 n=1 Tax=Exidia glandulosa HHB12029 TaxID=1314781 RepID=A0A165P1B3_EXIGL|nr:multidrug resistance protein 1 [Exidia glandulosa HHB12029]
MSDSSSTEKAPVPTKRRFWQREKVQPADAGVEIEKVAQTSEGEVVVKAAEPDLQPVGFFELFRFITKFELTLNLIGLVAAAAAGAAQPLMSLLFGKLTQAFVDFTTETLRPNPSPADIERAADHFRHTAATTASYLVYLGIGMFCATYTYMTTWTYTGEVNAKRVRERYLQAVLRQDIAFFDKLGAGEVTTRIQTDCHLIQQGISEKVALTVSYLGAFFTGFILAFIQSWKLALALASIFPCIIITGAFMNILIGKYVKHALDQTAAGGTLAEEVISTIRTAQAFGSQGILSGLYNKFVMEANKYDAKQSVIHGLGLGSFYFIIYSSYGLAFYFGTTLILSGDVNAGQVVNVFFAIMIGSFSIALLAPELQAISQARGAAAKLFSTIDRVPPIDSASKEGRTLDKVEGRITFENVKFRYPSRPDVPILKGLTITFEAGKTAALVGSSGSGKSTVVQLVERFYDPESGSVKLDGVDIRELNLKWLRSQIGLVSQEPVLFATTIRGNVAHGLIGTPWEKADDEKKMELIREACVKANADGFISNLPNGYETMVGERGFLLSGGQKQRIAIARAIVSDPKILLLDEATSALDTQSEGVVQNALDKAAAGRTTITIAHRLSTIKNANQIFVVGGGEILEHGTDEELMNSANGAYARLVEAQRLREAQAPTGDITPGEVEAAEPAEKTAAEIEADAQKEIPLGRRTSSVGSVTSEVLKAKAADTEEKEYSIIYLFRRMGRLNKDQWKSYVIGAFCAVATGSVYPSFGIVYGHGIQGFSEPDRHTKRVAGDRNALWFFLIAILSTFAIAGQNFNFARAAAMLTAKIRRLSFSAMLRQDIEFFDREENSTGSLTSSLSENASKVNGLAGVTLGTIFSSFSTLIVGSVIGLAYGWKLALVAIACIPFVLFGGYVRLRVVVLKDQINKKLHEQSAQLACEAAGAIRTVASLVREDDCCDLYSQSLEVPLQQSNRATLRSTALFALTQSLSFWVISLIFWYGSRLVASGEYKTQNFFIVLMSVTFGSIQAGNVFSFVPDISAAKGASSDVVTLLDAVPEVDSESTEGTVLKSVDGRIVFDDVHFRYPTRPGVRVLRGLNLTIEPSTFVALVGASGCGKSTVIQLTERFYDPAAGKVTLDGHPLTDLNVQEFRKHIALVSQEPTLYAGTVRFNILLGAIKPHDEVTQEEIEQACRDANILEFIQSLPDGFDTQVGGKGSQLSGGQKQRIAIARALLRNPKVLLLDEATSALDSTSEKVVQEALDKASRGRTTIAIAHRLSTIQNADCIYFIRDGRVAEAGTHDQLLARGGAYAEYVQLQALSKAT